MSFFKRKPSGPRYVLRVGYPCAMERYSHSYYDDLDIALKARDLFYKGHVDSNISYDLYDLWENKGTVGPVSSNHITWVNN